MKTQTYYTAPSEWSANICDHSKEIIINCIGAVHRNHYSTHSIRKDYYMMYVIKGCQQLIFDNTNCLISEGDLVILKPNTEYRYYTEGININYLWLHFTGSMAEQKLLDLGIKTNSILHCGYSVGIIDLWKRMCNEFTINDKHFQDMSCAIFTEILTAFSRRINKFDTKEYLLKSVIYIHENYPLKISVSKLADIEGFSESHYRALFVKYFGQTPVEYITNRRIEAAAYMLESTDCTLDEIAALVGYHDTYYFSKKFKQLMNISPGKYRKEHAEKQYAFR